MKSKSAKILSLVLLVVLTVGLSACNKNKSAQSEPQVEGAPETGVTIDLSDKSNQTVTTTPGDVLYLKLTGESSSLKQWTVVSPTSGDFLLLKDHKLIGLQDQEATEGKFNDEWWIKVERTGIFDLGFDYGVPGEEPEDSFEVKIISQ